MSKKIKISIIIASFKAVDLLPCAINSVLSQKHVSPQLIVVDGGSNDGTEDLLKSYGDNIYAWLSEPDKGIYNAWNKGVEIATGDWIGFLGADDIIYPHALSTYATFLGLNPGLDYVSSKVRLVYPNACERIIGQSWTWNLFRSYMNVAHVGSLHHKSLFDKYGKFDENLRICADYEFLLRAKDELKAGFVDSILVEMASGGISESSAKSIYETLSIKLRLKSVTSIKALFDFLNAYLKWRFRRFLRCFNSSAMKLSSPTLSSTK